MYWVLTNMSGSHHNRDVWTGHFADGLSINYDYRYWQCDRQEPRLQAEYPGLPLPSLDADHTQAVPRVIVDTADQFDQFMNLGRPFVIEGLDLGRCREEWTSSGLAKKINPGTTVCISFRVEHDRC